MYYFEKWKFWKFKIQQKQQDNNNNNSDETKQQQLFATGIFKNSTPK